MVSFLSLAALAAVPAPVANVTVFSDQARVTRSAQVSGPGVVEFPALPDSIDVSSVRVDTSTGEIRRVDLERLTPEAFRTAEAKQLLGELDQLDTELTRLQKEHSALQEHRDALNRLRPTFPPNDNVKPAARLNATTWNTAMQFHQSQLESAQKRLRDVELAQRTALKKRELLQHRANQLGNPAQRSGWKVVAVLAGGGPATVSLTYLVQSARWTPTWDVQLDPEKNLVTVSLAGQVSQESGEDWEDAQLTVSTAVPSSAVKAPTLLSWKIGTTERFIPTPTPVRENVRAVAPPPAVARAQSEETLVKTWLSRVMASSAPMGRADGDRREFKKEAAPKPYAPAPPPPPEPMKQQFEFDGADIESEEAADEPAVVYRAPAVPMAIAESASAGPRAQAASTPLQRERTSQFSLAPPPGFSAPRYGADSPVTLAGGYDLTFTSRQRETVPSAKGARRVALWSQQWPVSVERKVFPALAREAYLTAELKNPSQQVLPGGPATLSVGADPAGTARLKLVSPGEVVTLPLGLDRAIKTVRNVQVIDATEGVLTKEDLSTYAVTIELLNPYRTPVALRVFDQWPLAHPNQKDLETKLLDSKPTAIQEAATGRLEWRLTLKPNEKQTLSFRYQVKRPKSWRLYQQEVQP